MVETVTESGRCYFCKREVDAGSYCYGCKEYVCEDCDNAYDLMGEHHVEDHKSDRE